VDPEYPRNLKKGYHNWWTVKGKWVDPTDDGFEAVKGKSGPGTGAAIVFGDDDWKDYDLQVAVRCGDEGGAGILFHFQDSNHYDRYQWHRKGAKWVQQLVRTVDGVDHILSEQPGAKMEKGIAYWYKLDLKTKGDSVKVLLDDEPVFLAADSSLRGEGKAGFWTTSDAGTDFDDISVSSIADLRPAPSPSRLEYDLYWEQKPISVAYAGWTPSDDKVFGLIDPVHTPYMCVNKGLFETPFFYHKKTFPGTPGVKVTADGVAKDVDVDYEVCAYTAGQKSVYRFTIAVDKLRITKDARVVFTAEAPLKDRSSISVVKTPRDWQVQVDTSKFSYPDPTKIDSVRIGIGYSGMGKARISITDITIDNIPTRK
jgi:hypothetical protein